MNFWELIYFPGWVVLLGVIAAGLWRLARGPSVFDRIIGFDTVMVAMVGWLVLFSIRAGTEEYLELIMVVTALGFFTTVAYFYYFSQSDGAGEDES